MTPIVIYSLIFVATLLVADTVVRGVLNARRSKAEIKNRLEFLKEGTEGDSAARALLIRRGLNADGPTLFSFGWFSRIYSQSGIELSTVQRALLLLGLAVLGALAASFILPDALILQVLIGVVFSGLSFLGYVAYRRHKRIKRFVSQMAPAIDTMVRSIKAGHPVTSAIAMVAREMPDPIGSEFGVLSDQMTFGSGLDDALMRMLERVGAPEINLLAVTLTVQRGTGGNLAEILENLAHMIRERLLLKSKIRAISAEGRFTSWVMIVFPFLLFFMIRTLVPDYYTDLIDTGYFGIIAIGCLVMIAIGAFILNRMVNFDF